MRNDIYSYDNGIYMKEIQNGMDEYETCKVTLLQVVMDNSEFYW